MKIRGRVLLGVALLWPWAAADRAFAAASPWIETEQTEVRLIAAADAVGSGDSVLLGLHFRLRPGWKIYWRSPGDAGFPPRPDWSGSTNLATARLLWPAPERFSVVGFETLGYKDEVVLPVAVTLARAGQPLGLRAAVGYLTCKEICVPYTADLALDLPAGTAGLSRHAHLINRFSARVPGDGTAHGLSIGAAEVAGAGRAAVLRVSATATMPFEAPDVFVEGPPELTFGRPRVRLSADRMEASLEVAVDGMEDFDGDLTGSRVTVTVVDPTAADAEPRDVRIRTVTSLRDIKYEEWIADNRDFVDRESDGQIVYMHIRSMNQPALEKFESEIDQFFYKKGAVIDVRYNGGGNIDQQLMDILERKPYQITWSKTSSPVWGRRPKQTIVGPKVMMINWCSGSDAEMTPHGFRHLGLGRLVGTPTNGAVVSAGRYGLLDGGSTRIPRTRVVSFDPTQPNNWGFNLENYGVPPDVWVRNTPEDEINSYKRELKMAVDEALRMLEEGEGTWQYIGPARRNGDR